MFCPNCGGKIDDDATFCENCGTKIEQTAVNDKIEQFVAVEHGLDETQPPSEKGKSLIELIKGLNPKIWIGIGIGLVVLLIVIISICFSRKGNDTPAYVDELDYGSSENDATDTSKEKQLYSYMEEYEFGTANPECGYYCFNEGVSWARFSDNNKSFMGVINTEGELQYKRELDTTIWSTPNEYVTPFMNGISCIYDSNHKDCIAITNKKGVLKDYSETSDVKFAGYTSDGNIILSQHIYDFDNNYWSYCIVQPDGSNKALDYKYDSFNFIGNDIKNIYGNYYFTRDNRAGYYDKILNLSTGEVYLSNFALADDCLYENNVVLFDGFGCYLCKTDIFCDILSSHKESENKDDLIKDKSTKIFAPANWWSIYNVTLTGVRYKDEEFDGYYGFDGKILINLKNNSLYDKLFNADSSFSSYFSDEILLLKLKGSDNQMYFCFSDKSNHVLCEPIQMDLGHNSSNFDFICGYLFTYDNKKLVIYDTNGVKLNIEDILNNIQPETKYIGKYIIISDNMLCINNELYNLDNKQKITSVKAYYDENYQLILSN